MIPKEKAQDLVDKFYAINPNNGQQAAKQCALIAVDEFLDFLLNQSEIDVEHDDYWKEVKEEIEKL